MEWYEAAYHRAGWCFSSSLEHQLSQWCNAWTAEGVSAEKLTLQGMCTAKRQRHVCEQHGAVQYSTCNSWLRSWAKLTEVQIRTLPLKPTVTEPPTRMGPPPEPVATFDPHPVTLTTKTSSRLTTRTGNKSRATTTSQQFPPRLNRQLQCQEWKISFRRAGDKIRPIA